MAVAFDVAATAVGHTSTPTTGTIETQTITVAAGSDQMILAFITIGIQGPDTDAGYVLAPTVDGNPMTDSGLGKIHAAGSNEGFGQLFYYALGNTAGGAHTVAFTMSGGTITNTAFFTSTMNAIAVTGANQITPFRVVSSATGTGTSASKVVTAGATTELVISAEGGGSSLTTHNQTSIYTKNQSTASQCGNAGMGRAAGSASSVTMTRTLGSDSWMMIAGALQAASGSTPISGSDSGTLTEGTPKVGVASTESGALTEGTPKVGLTTTGESGTATEGTPKVGVASTESGALTEAGTIAATASSSESGTVTEGTPSIALSATGETGTGTEGTPSIGTTSSETGTLTEGTPTVALTAAGDTGTLTDTGTIAATLTSSESGALTEAQSIAVLVTDSDSGTFTEGTPSIAVSSTETATGTDAEAVTAALSSTDSGTFTEGTAKVGLAGSDTGTLTEGTPAIAATLTSSETGTFVDDGSVDTGDSNKSSSDSGTFTEGTPRIALTTAGESATFTETQKITISSAETGTFTETQSIDTGDAAKSDSDSGTFTEGPAVIHVSSAETGTFIDLERLALFSVESGTFVDETLPLGVRAAGETGTLTETESVDRGTSAPTPGRVTMSAIELPPAIEISAAATGSIAITTLPA